jgi:AraC-like DNA-binding protein
LSERGGQSLFRIFGDGNHQSRHVREHAEQVRAYLEANLTQDLDMNAVARAASISPFYLTRIFKQRYGVPPYRYLIGLRIDYASDLLRESSLSVTQALPSIRVQLAVALHHDLPASHRHESVAVPTRGGLAAGCGKVRAEDRTAGRTAPPYELLRQTAAPAVVDVSSSQGTACSGALRYASAFLLLALALTASACEAERRATQTALPRPATPVGGTLKLALHRTRGVRPAEEYYGVAWRSTAVACCGRCSTTAKTTAQGGADVNPISRRRCRRSRRTA